MKWLRWPRILWNRHVSYKRQLRRVDEHLERLGWGWEGTGRGRIETLYRMAGEPSPLRSTHNPSKDAT